MLPTVRRHWTAEYEALILEDCGGDKEKAAKSSMENMLKVYAKDIDTMIADFGWSRDDANAVQMLIGRRACLTRALRERDPRYSASTYFFCDFLAEQAGRPAPRLF